MTGYQYAPNGEAPTRNEPSVVSSVAWPCPPSDAGRDCAAVPAAKAHLSNEASDPVAEPSKMYVKPGSGGGAVYCAPAATGNAPSATAVRDTANVVRRIFLLLLDR